MAPPIEAVELALEQPACEVANELRRRGMSMSVRAGVRSVWQRYALEKWPADLTVCETKFHLLHVKGVGPNLQQTFLHAYTNWALPSYMIARPRCGDGSAERPGDSVF